MRPLNIPRYKFQSGTRRKLNSVLDTHVRTLCACHAANMACTHANNKMVTVYVNFFEENRPPLMNHRRKIQFLISKSCCLNYYVLKTYLRRLKQKNDQ